MTESPDLPEDEQELLEAFARLAPEGSAEWNFESSMRRLSTPAERPTWVGPWSGLPADLWERGRATKASERVMGDVIKVVAQDLTDYTQQAVDELRRFVPEASAVDAAIRSLAARVERLERTADPLGIRPTEFDLPATDAREWARAVPAWLDGGSGLPVVVGELSDRSVLDALADAGVVVEGVDPRGAVFWAAEEAAAAQPDAHRAQFTLRDVVDHLDGLASSSRSGVVLSGCIDRASLAEKLALVDAALAALTPGGTLVLLVADQQAWDAAIDLVSRDLLPGRPFHPDTWAVVLAHRGMADVEVHRAAQGSVHAIVTRKGS